MDGVVNLNVIGTVRRFNLAAIEEELAGANMT
jgi:hypothetical protein